MKKSMVIFADEEDLRWMRERLRDQGLFVDEEDWDEFGFDVLEVIEQYQMMVQLDEIELVPVP